jgi:hypothetical protein
MKELRSLIIRTTCGKPFDLSKAAPVACNTSAPFGKHNFIVYRTIKGFYLKGYNTGNKKKMLDSFELISRGEAMHYLNLQLGNTVPGVAHR